MRVNPFEDQQDQQKRDGRNANDLKLFSHHPSGLDNSIASSPEVRDSASVNIPARHGMLCTAAGLARVHQKLPSQYEGQLPAAYQQKSRAVRLQWNTQKEHGCAAPKVIFSPSAEYSKEALRAKDEGVCILQLIITLDGYPRNEFRWE